MEEFKNGRVALQTKIKPFFNDVLFNLCLCNMMNLETARSISLPSHTIVKYKLSKVLDEIYNKSVKDSKHIDVLEHIVTCLLTNDTRAVDHFKSIFRKMKHESDKPKRKPLTTFGKEKYASSNMKKRKLEKNETENEP
ncbi:MAG: hypothetical protein K0U78_18570 [Actinomycetia bacterium]|nr:hypothetical protein [Actinomycetes bacterium]